MHGYGYTIHTDDSSVWAGTCAALAGLVGEHYRVQAVLVVSRIVGSMPNIGNPLGLLSRPLSPAPRLPSSPRSTFALPPVTPPACPAIAEGGVGRVGVGRDGGLVGRGGYMA